METLTMEEIGESRRLAGGVNGLADGWTALPRETRHGRMDPQGLLLPRVDLLVFRGSLGAAVDPERPWELLVATCYVASKGRSLGDVFGQ